MTHLPKNLLPKNLLPKNLLPKNLLPKNLLPKNLLPKNLLPKNLLPKNLLSRTGNDAQTLSGTKLRTREVLKTGLGLRFLLLLAALAIVVSLRAPVTEPTGVEFIIGP
jgi:hypothetical protein